MPHIQPTGLDDAQWIAEFVRARWGAEIVVARGRLHRPSELPGFAAVVDGERVGLITYHIEGRACEIVTLDSLRPGMGIGTALVRAAAEAARQARCRRLWLITTNDNLAALRFYQKRGFRLAALHRGAVDIARRLKPEIPFTGADGIPLRDELELETPPGDIT